MGSEITKIFANALFKAKSDTLDNWQSNNPILLSGEPSVVTGKSVPGDGLQDPTQVIKFGDGVNNWNDLPWWLGPTGPQGIQGEKGEDYILTEQDKTEIANLVLSNFIDVSEVGL